MMRTDPVDIYVVGTGMVGARQLTREAIAALERSERLYLVHFQKSIVRYLEEFTEDIVILNDEYTDGENRRDTYARMAERVLDGAEQADGPVAFALYGHPAVLCLRVNKLWRRHPLVA